MRGLTKAAILLAPVLALARHLDIDSGKTDVAPVVATVDDIQIEGDHVGTAVEDDGQAAFDMELLVYQDLLAEKARLQEMIMFQEQLLADEFGWPPHACGGRECHGFKCLVESIYETVSDTVAAIYEGVVGVEDVFDGPPSHGHGPPWWKHPKHPKHGKPCKKPHKPHKPHCPGKFPHHGNHTHGNHTHPPHHRFPHHPPPFCPCPPPPPDHPPHRGPPHHSPPDDDKPPYFPNFHDDEDNYVKPPVPYEGESDTSSEDVDEQPPSFTPPGRKPPSHPKDHGVRPPPPPGHRHGPHGHGLPLPFKIVGASILFLFALALHRRCYRSCVARREARRRRRAARREFVKRLLCGRWFKRGGGASQEEKEAMLHAEEETTSLEDELVGCRVAADMVGEMVAAEEGRARREPRVTPGHVTLGVVPVPVSARYTVPVDEVLPAYDEASESSDGVADGLRYTPGSSVYAPSSRGGSDEGHLDSKK